ncbi:MAG TPA: serine/threonine-protein kinase [Acidimicrobiales bacterium]|nr:serine/threonine-protein kinase [Acidimicrobiales bacterium]
MALAAAPEISGFRALSPLGYGPTSTIYSAQADALGRWVALTVYTTALPNERAQRRFDRSFEVARRLGAHPHIVTMLESGLTFERQPYVATEIYERGTLQTRVEGRQPQSIDDVLHMGVQLAGALETAHRAEVVHGGIHPARVLLSNEGEPALADLGLVPLVDRGGLAALVSPMSFHAPPEVLEARPVIPATDVYALASTLYAALAGRAPYQRGDDDTTAALLVRILQHDVPPLGRSDVPGSLEETLRRALRSEPEDRQARALAFARELQSCQKELGLPVSQPIVLDVAASIRLASDASTEPRLAVAPVVEPAPPSQPMQRVFVPAPEEPDAAAPEPTPAPAPPVAAEPPTPLPTAPPPLPEPLVPGPFPPPTSAPSNGFDPGPFPPPTSNPFDPPPGSNGFGHDPFPAPPAPPPGPNGNGFDPFPAPPDPLPGPNGNGFDPFPPPTSAPAAGPESFDLDSLPVPTWAAPPPEAPVVRSGYVDLGSGDSFAPPPSTDHVNGEAFEFGMTPEARAEMRGEPAPAPKVRSFDSHAKGADSAWGPVSGPDSASVLEPAAPATAVEPAPSPSWQDLAAPPGTEVRSPFAGVQSLDLRPRDGDAPTTAAPPMRALPVIVLVALVVVLGAGLAWAVTTKDPAESDAANDADASATSGAPPADEEIPHVAVTAVENPSGVQLDWDGGSDGNQMVLVLSETETPRLLPAETGTALLVPGNSLAAANGYCFAVTTTSNPPPAPALLAADLPDEALSPAACIRGASPTTVRRD